jgi:4-amino-4-deoxy-L-arabinose transferase-like glycosyltransferase
MRLHRSANLVFTAGLCVWVINALILLWSAYPLGHDEAQYAGTGKDLLAGVAPRQFYVSTGMRWVAAPGVLAGGSELALRVVPALFGLAFVLATWQLAHRLCGPVTAAWTVAVLAASRCYTLLAVDLLSDVPAAACLIAATVAIVDELARDAPRWQLVLAAPLLAAAFYLRYGSCLPIAILCALAIGVGWRAVRARPLPVLATAALLVVLLVPHALYAYRTQGSPLGILLESEHVPWRRSRLDGLITYLTVNPFSYYGLVMPPVLIAGLAGLRRDHRSAFVWLAAIASIVALGVTTHAQARYILFGTVLLVILGVDLWRRVAGARSSWVRCALVGACAAAVIAGWVTVTLGSLRVGPRRRVTTRPVLAAAAAIAADARGRPCVVFGDAYTQLEWYSGCIFGMDLAGDVARGALIYVVRPEPDDLRGLSSVALAVPGIEVVRVARGAPP